MCLCVCVCVCVCVTYSMSSYKAWSYRVKYSPRTHQLSACHVRKGQFLFYFFVTVETVCTVCKKKLLLPRKGFGGVGLGVAEKQGSVGFM